jgi:hypothetical protein
MTPKDTRNVDRAAPKRTAHTPHDPVSWERGNFLEVAADRTLESVLRLIRKEGALWIVIVRPRLPDVYYYAFRASELEHLASNHPERGGWVLVEAMELHEWKSSATVRGGRPLGFVAGSDGPAAQRIVELDAGGRVAAVGVTADELVAVLEGDPNADAGPKINSEVVPEAEADGDGDSKPPGPRSFSLPGYDYYGPARSVPTRRAQDAEIEITLSAETNAEINVGATAQVLFQIELTSEAIPLAVFLNARAKQDVPIVVSLSVENDAIEIIGFREYTLGSPGQPGSGFFRVKGVREGLCRLAVLFRQGGSELGLIGLAVEVLATAAVSSAKTKGAAVGAPRDVTDDDKLALLIEQRTDCGQVFYEYTLHSEALGLPYQRVRSKPLLDSGNGPAATAIAFVERMYERVTREMKSRDDLKQLEREARDLGAYLCRKLFDPEVTKVLWPLRERIKLIQIVSWEPYIPWELVRLRDPDSGDIDDRFLCEYGLVRTLSDEMPPRVLPMRDWAYLGATFPLDSFPPVGAELDYFTKTSAESLRGHGITPKAIAATRDSFYDALTNGDFDVLHISCHAESAHQAIDRASLIIGDETVPGDTRPRPVEVDTIIVETEARLRKRRPLVFLNACETGRVGVVLTAWGGWPNVFLRQGAGAFVGESWAVRDKPAATFSTTFYNALLGGKNLSEAANAARGAAKEMGDASWLAFKVYGHPRARRIPA